MCWLYVGRDLSFRSGDGRMVVARKTSEWLLCCPSKISRAVAPTSKRKGGLTAYPPPCLYTSEDKVRKSWPPNCVFSVSKPTSLEGRIFVTSDHPRSTWFRFAGWRQRQGLWHPGPSHSQGSAGSVRQKTGSWSQPRLPPEQEWRPATPPLCLPHLSLDTQWQGKEWKGILMIYCEMCGNTKCSVNS